MLPQLFKHPNYLAEIDLPPD